MIMTTTTTTTRGIITRMTDAHFPVQEVRPSQNSATQALLRLITWLSPAFPIGAFSYSSGLEQAVADGAVSNAPSLTDWLSGSLRQGSQWNDAVLLAESYHAQDDAVRLRDVAALAEAMAGSRERQMETMLQGEAFLTAAAAWPSGQPAGLGGRAAYPVAVGAIAGAHATGLEAALAAYLHAGVSNQISVAIRCSVLGQHAGVALLARLEGDIAETAARTADSTLDDLGSAAILSDIAGLRHETLTSRLFRS
jgi:urease accessory protein